MPTPGASSPRATRGITAPCASSSDGGRAAARRHAAALALLPAATAASYAAGWALGSPWLLPILNTLPAFPWLVASLRRGRPAEAIGRMLVWAASLGVCASALAAWQPQETSRLFLHAEAYQRDMFAWVATGVGAESDPVQFVPRHAAHAALFGGLSLVSGSALSMPMGAVLMNYMGHYAGTLAAASPRPLLTAVLAWPPWAIVRVASFAILGVILAGPVLSRAAGFRFRVRDQRRWLGLAVAGLAVDVLLKWRVAPAWAELLRRVAGWSS